MHAKKSAQKPGAKIEHELDQLYISRKSRGDERVSLNKQTINKVPGAYNDKGSVNVQVLTSTESFDIFNLTA